MPPLHFILVGHCAGPQRNVWLCARLKTLISSCIFFKLLFISLGFWNLPLFKLRSPPQASFPPSSQLFCDVMHSAGQMQRRYWLLQFPCSMHLPRFIGKESTSWNGQSILNGLCGKQLVQSDQFWPIQMSNSDKATHETIQSQDICEMRV